jgi:3-hydroxyacyl-CoA dehydrogenase
MSARLITKVGIIGCGFMGAGIATSLIVHNISVILKDQNSVLLEASMKQIKGVFVLKKLILQSILT